VRIACLGWGSLVWDPRSLPLNSGWYADGPGVHVDYYRQSNDQRLTLVLHPSAELSRSLWSLVAAKDLLQAAQSLADRECMPSTRAIGSWSIGDSSPPTIPNLDAWAQTKNLTHVIWTDLPVKFNGQQVPPTREEALAYLRTLPPEVSIRAEEYVRRTPAQVQTALRRTFEREMHWTAV